MDRQTIRQLLIEQKQLEVAAQYPALWSRIISEWRHTGEEDCVWLMYSANYLMRTGNVRWAIDPLSLQKRVPQAPAVEAVRDLQGLDFVLLTHSHADHLDFSLLMSLKELPIRWVIPAAILPHVLAQTGLPESQVWVAQAMQPLELMGIRINPFNGLHWAHHPGLGITGVPATGYLAEFNGKRWLFPGDTRTYDAAQLPDFGQLDGVFAHLWLGKGSALEENPTLLTPFCNFFVDLKPRRIVFTHLRELGRMAEDYWDLNHFQMVKKRLKELSPDIQLDYCLMGGRINL